MSISNSRLQALNLRQVLTQFWRISAPLTLVGITTFGLILLMLAGLLLDNRVITGAPAWLKPSKFAFAASLHSFTFLWLLSFIRKHQRLVSFAANATALGFVVEMVIIAVQAARGTTSHFNVSTPLDETLWRVMGIAIIVLWAGTLVAAILLLRQRLDNSVLAIALRLSLILSFIGMGLGFLMTRPTPEQNLALQAGQAVLQVGAHSVGVPDGGSGIPVLNWSTQGGDLRVPHFVGIHALQVFPLVSWLITSRFQHLKHYNQVALMWIFSLAYAGLMFLLTWQALRTQPFTSPDALTLTALAGLVAVTGVAVLATLWSDRNQSISIQQIKQ